MTIGVLAVQGAFIEHRKMLDRLGVNSMEIRNKADLSKAFEGIILPGGESTVMGKLLSELDMMDGVRRAVADGMPIFGTCAGMILLAKTIANRPVQHLGTMDISVLRNAYGRQLGSFNTVSSFNGKQIPMRFIRAPYVESAGEDVEILARVDGHIVAARQGRQLATAFHPELTENTTVHRYFLKIAEDRN